MSEQCDRGLPNGKRCKNEPTQWVHLTFRPNKTTVEDWPVLVCDECGKAGGMFNRMGPDRRQQYAEWKQQEQS